jgi:hypothetical protein
MMAVGIAGVQVRGGSRGEMTVGREAHNTNTAYIFKFKHCVFAGSSFASF